MTLRVVADTSGADVAAPTIPPARDTLRPTADYRKRGVRGWQEAESTAARDKLRRQRPCNRHYFPTPGPARAIPISWKYSQFSKRASGYRLTHKGEAGVTPNRYVTWALRRHRDTQAEFLFLNTHFISGAFSGSHPERQGRWIRHRDEVRDLVAALKDRYPRRPVFVVGDFNRRRAVHLPGVTYVPRGNASGVGLDHIYTSPNTPRSRSWLKGDYGSDHRAIIAWVKITARS